jgi:hypothetical protein
VSKFFFVVVPILENQQVVGMMVEVEHVENKGEHH